MAQSLSQILLHVVFSTKERQALIEPANLPDLHAYLAATCQHLGSHAYRVGGTDNHVHIACTLPRTLTVSKLLEQIKSSSSKWVKTHQKKPFSWQGGYGAFSIGQSQVEALIGYIGRQNEHHRKVSYQEELRALLERYQVKYDERHVWD